MPLSRTARALSATALTSLVLGTAATAATADPGAEVSPRTVAPGGTVTVSVSCETSGGHPPETVDATSRAFERGTVRLHRHGTKDAEDPAGTRADDPADTGMEDPAGMADPSADEHSADGGDPVIGEDSMAEGDPMAEGDSVVGGVPVAGGDPATGGDPAAGDDSTADGNPVGSDGSAVLDDPAGTDDPKGDDGPGSRTVYSGTARVAPAADFGEGGPDGAGGTSEWSVGGVCPTAHGGAGKKWSASFTVSLRGHGTAARHGVHAGTGGAFDDSALALVSGGVLVAGALGAAVHRLRRREPSSRG